MSASIQVGGVSRHRYHWRQSIPAGDATDKQAASRLVADSCEHGDKVVLWFRFRTGRGREQILVQRPEFLKLLKKKHGSHISHDSSPVRPPNGPSRHEAHEVPDRHGRTQRGAGHRTPASQQGRRGVTEHSILVMRKGIAVVGQRSRRQRDERHAESPMHTAHYINHRRQRHGLSDQPAVDGNGDVRFTQPSRKGRDSYIKRDRSPDSDWGADELDSTTPMRPNQREQRRRDPRKHVLRWAQDVAASTSEESFQTARTSFEIDTQTEMGMLANALHASRLAIGQAGARALDFVWQHAGG